MSMVRCDGCDRFIDSDDDPECFWPPEVTPNSDDKVYCEWCREERGLNWDEYFERKGN